MFELPEFEKVDFIFLEFHDARYTANNTVRTYFKVICDNKVRILAVGPSMAAQIEKLLYKERFSLVRTKKEVADKLFYNEWMFQKHED